MFKLLGALVAGAMLLTSQPAFAVSGPQENAADLIDGLTFTSPQIMDISLKDFVIEKQIFANGDSILTTLTLSMQQDIKGKIVGQAKFNSTQPVTGKPTVALPATIPIVGTVKGSTFSVKGTLKIAGGADYHSRTIGLKVSGYVIPDAPFEYAELLSEDTSESKASFYTSVNISGLGFGYSFDRVVEYSNDFNFHVQKSEDVAGLKPLPANTRYFEISLPGIFALGKGYMQLGTPSDTPIDYYISNSQGSVEINNAILTPATFTIKAKGVQSTIVGQKVEGTYTDEFDISYPVKDFVPEYYSVKSKSVNIVNEPAIHWGYAGFYVIYPGQK